MKKVFFIFLVFSLLFVACKEETIEIEKTYRIEFTGWEDSSAYFINYTKDAASFGYDTFYQKFSHEFVSLPSHVDSIYFDVTDTLERYLEVIFKEDGKEVYRKTEQANIGFMRAVWFPEN